MSVGMKARIETTLKKATGRNITVEKGMGFDNYHANTKGKGMKIIDALNPRNNTLTDSMKRWMASQKDVDDPKNAALFDHDHLYCRQCGAKLTLNDIHNGHKLCSACRNARKREARKDKLEENTNNKQICSTDVVTITEFPKVKLLNEEEQKQLNNEMCHVGTIAQLFEHAPDRAFVFANFGTYSPTINNYYGTQQA